MPQRGATIFEAKKPTRRRLPPQNKKKEKEKEKAGREKAKRQR